MNSLELYVEVDGSSSVQCISYHSCCVYYERSTPLLYSSSLGSNRPTAAGSFAWGPVLLEGMSMGVLARYATKAMLATAAMTELRGSLDAAKGAIPHVIAHKLATTIAKKRKRLEKPQSKKASVDTGLHRSHRRIWYCIGLTENDW